MARQVKFGPLSRGIYVALWSVAPVVLILNPPKLIYYVLFLLFLGFGLRPFLEITGLYGLWNDIGGGARNKWDKKFLQERAKEIESQEKLKKFHNSRVRDPKLPKNW